MLLGAGVIAAETDERARLLATSQQQSFIALRTGRPGRLPPPVEGLEDKLDPGGRSLLNQVLSRAIIGSPDTARARRKAFAEETGGDEIMVTGHMFDHADRLASSEIINGVADALA